MKVLILVCLVFAAGCQGSFLDSLKDTLKQVGGAFTDTFKQVGQQAKVVGQGLLDQLKQSGTQLAGQALQSLLLGATTALTGGTTGKRDLEALHLPEKLKTFIEGKVDNMHEVFNSGVDALAQVGSTSHSAEFVKLVSTVDELVHAHHATLNNLLHELIEGVEEHFGKALHHIPAHKRSAFTDLLGNVGQSVAAFFQPHIDGLKQVVGALGQGVTQTAQQMQTQAKPHVDEIKNSGQVVVQHGKNALQALKDAVTDILHQTLTSMQPHLVNIAQHAGQIAAQSAGQLANNLGQTVLGALGAAATSAPSS